MSIEGVLRVAAVGDVHCNKSSRGTLQALFVRINADADVLLLCGDLVDHGLPEEARILAHEIAGVVQIPAIAVLGNHDFEAGRQAEIAAILDEVGVQVLDGESREVNGVGFAGVKGFAGGFGDHALGAWGEPAIKAFVHEALSEALKLETALARLQTPQRIAVLHYAPIARTVEGEAPEIFPFLGSSRLEEPLNRYHVAAVFHGHAHGGTLEGRTGAGAPVYNVSMALLQREFPDRAPFRLVEIPTAGVSDPYSVLEAAPG